MALRNFQIDPAAQKEGMIVKSFGYFWRIGHAENKRFQNRVEALMRPHRRLFAQIETLAASDSREDRRQAEELREKQDQLTKQAAAESILLGWAEDAEFTRPWIQIDEDGPQIEYSPKAAYELLSDPANVDIWRFVDRAASDSAAWQQYTRELRGKGSSSGEPGNDSSTPPPEPKKATKAA